MCLSFNIQNFTKKSVTQVQHTGFHAGTTGRLSLKSAKGMVRPCSRPASECWQGSPKTRRARHVTENSTLASGWARREPSRSQHLEFGSLTRSRLHPVPDALTDLRIGHAVYGPLTDLGATRSHGFGDPSPCFRRMFPASSFHHRRALILSRTLQARTDISAGCPPLRQLLQSGFFLLKKSKFCV